MPNSPDTRSPGSGHSRLPEVTLFSGRRKGVADRPQSSLFNFNELELRSPFWDGANLTGGTSEHRIVIPGMKKATLQGRLCSIGPKQETMTRES
jgi:hypothetical protein